MSISTVLGLVCTLGVFVFFFVFRKRLNKQYEHMKAGAVASRLGMQLVKGNPEHNLVTMSVQPAANNLSSGAGWARQMVAGSIGGDLGAFDLRMGTADAELVLFCKQELAIGYATNTTTTTHDLRLTAFARIPGPFILRLRRPQAGMEIHRKTPEVVMPVHAFGDPVLDERFVLETMDPTLAQRIRPMLAVLLELSLYVHLEGSPRGISFVMTPGTVNYAAMYVEKLLPMLRSMGAALEGRPVLARTA